MPCVESGHATDKSSYLSSTAYLVIAVGVAAESEDERQSQKERQDETLGMVKKIDPRLWTELSRALGR